MVDLDFNLVNNTMHLKQIFLVNSIFPNTVFIGIFIDQSNVLTESKVSTSFTDVTAQNAVAFESFQMNFM